jgi:hypothetical protein
MSWSTTTSCQGALATCPSRPDIAVAAGKLEELVAQRHIFFQAKREPMVGPRAMHVHSHLGIGVPGDVVEKDRWALLA